MARCQWARAGMHTTVLRLYCKVVATKYPHNTFLHSVLQVCYPVQALALVVHAALTTHSLSLREAPQELSLLT